MKRAYYLLMALLMTAATTFSAQAQNSRNGVSIEIRDGKVFVNGEEAEGGEDGKYVIEQEDGDDITVFFDSDNGMFWFGDGEEGGHFRNRARMGGSGEFLFRNDGGSVRGLSSPGALFFPNGELDLESGHLSELHERLENQMAHARELYGGASGGVWELLSESQDSEVRKLEREIRELALQIGRTDADDRSELETELDQLLARAFDQKLETERERVASMESRLNEAMDRINERASARRDIIARRRAELLGERNDLDW